MISPRECGGPLNGVPAGTLYTLLVTSVRCGEGVCNESSVQRVCITLDCRGSVSYGHTYPAISCDAADEAAKYRISMSCPVFVETRMALARKRADDSCTHRRFMSVMIRTSSMVNFRRSTWIFATRWQVRWPMSLTRSLADSASRVRPAVRPRASGPRRHIGASTPAILACASRVSPFSCFSSIYLVSLTLYTSRAAGSTSWQQRGDERWPARQRHAIFLDLSVLVILASCQWHTSDLCQLPCLPGDDWHLCIAQTTDSRELADAFVETSTRCSSRQAV